jgi:hypothetical protein
MLKIRFHYTAFTNLGMMSALLSIILYVLSGISQPLIYVGLAFFGIAMFFLGWGLIFCTIQSVKLLPGEIRKIFICK